MPVNPMQNQIGKTNLQDSDSKDSDPGNPLSNPFAPEYNLSCIKPPKIFLTNPQSAAEKLPYLQSAHHFAC